MRHRKFAVAVTEPLVAACHRVPLHSPEQKCFLLCPLLRSPTLSLLLGVPCTENDYKLWSPSDERGNECLLGHKTVFKRRTPHATCFNGEDFDRPVMVSNCSCTREDFEW